MKVAVYAIAKNEEKFVARWCESAREADYLSILDTGSTDGTVDVAANHGVHVWQRTYNPWRFDTARNDSLKALPADIDLCIALDLDEELQPGWRERLAQAHADGVTRPRYQYTWSWNGNRPGLVYGGDKIHARHGYQWRHPVHEIITPLGVEVQGWCGVEIHHHPDPGKSRSTYLPLLELSVREDPDDDRNAHYYARELLFAGRRDDAAAEFHRHLSLPSAVWAPERARSMRYLFDCTGDVEWLHKAAREAPGRREAGVELAYWHHNAGQWEACLSAAVTALAITERPLDYLCEEFAWGPLPHDLAAVAAHRLGLRFEAHAHGLAALRLDPYDPRLAGNLSHYERAAA
jgi:glycosyltransferase involved in cell wall biosynthesis